MEDKDLRVEKALRRLGTRNPECNSCGETNPLVLTGHEPDIVCYECKQAASGKSTVEKHHVAGQHNDPTTVPVGANDHRLLSNQQRDWPKETLQNPSGSPLRKAAGALRGFIEWLTLVLDRVLGWIPGFLEQLDEHLTERNGESWWTEMEVDRS